MSLPQFTEIISDGTINLLWIAVLNEMSRCDCFRDIHGEIDGMARITYNVQCLQCWNCSLLAFFIFIHYADILWFANVFHRFQKKNTFGYIDWSSFLSAIQPKSMPIGLCWKCTATTAYVNKMTMFENLLRFGFFPSLSWRWTPWTYLRLLNFS